MKLTKDPTKALLHILNPTDYAYINVGLLKTPQIERRYAVSSGIGFDADVCYHNNLSSKLKHFLNKCKLGKLFLYCHCAPFAFDFQSKIHADYTG